MVRILSLALGWDSVSPHLLVQTVADGEHHRRTHQGTRADVTLAKVVHFLVQQANGGLIGSSTVPSTARCSRRLYAALLDELAVRVTWWDEMGKLRLDIDYRKVPK